MKIDHLKNEAIQIILISKKCFPQSRLFIFIFLYFKFIGTFIISNSFSFSRMTKANSIDIFRPFTYYASLSRTHLHLITYDYYLLIIYIIILIPIVFCVIDFVYLMNCSKELHHKELHRTKTIVNIHFLKEQKLVNFSEYSQLKIKLIQINTYLFMCIVLSSQHIIEILSFCYCLYFRNNTLLSNERQKLLFSKLFIIYPCINTLFIFIVNVYIIIFYIVYNSPFISTSNPFNHNHNKYTLSLLIILFNFQSIHYYPRILRSGYWNIILICVCCVILFLVILLSIKQYIYINFYNGTFYSFIFFAFFSCIVSAVIESQYENTNKLKSSYYTLKNIVLIIFTFISMYSLIHLKRKISDKSVTRNIFRKNKTITSNYIYRLIELLGHFKNDIKIFHIVDEMLQKHHEKCNVQDDCKTNLFNVKDLFKTLKLTQTKNYFDIKENEYNYIKRYYSTLVLIENEISNFLHSLYVKNNLLIRMDILLLHCDFIYYYRKHRFHALYLIQEYLLRIRKIPFNYVIYFYTLKEEILKHWGDDKNLTENNNYSKNITIHGEVDPKLTSFYNYYENICTIKKYLFQICNEFQYVLTYKHSYLNIQNNNNSNNMTRSNINYIALIYNSIMYINHLLNLLKHNLSENYMNNILRNPEMCYLLTNFFEITHKEKPKYIQYIFLFIKEYYIVDEFETSFDEIKYEHPFIFSASDNTIGYFSGKLAKYLKYKQRELIGANIHILLPPIFEQQHNLEMKRGLFMYKMFSMEKDVFIIDKEGHYIKGYIYMGLLPTLTNKLLLISDLSLRNNALDNSYLIVMDEYTNLITMTSNFEEKFHLTSEMIRKLKITFCNFFSFDYEKITKDFKQKLNSIKEINLREINEIISPFVSSNINTVLRLREINTDMRISSSKIKFTKLKSFVKKNLELIKTKIADIDYYNENDWMERVRYTESILLNDIKLNPNSIFEISIELKHIGNLPFYHVKIYDKENNSFFIKTKNISPHNRLSNTNTSQFLSNIKLNTTNTYNYRNSIYINSPTVFRGGSPMSTNYNLVTTQTGRENSNTLNSTLLNSNSSSINSTSKNLLITNPHSRTNSSFLQHIQPTYNKKEFSHLSKEDLDKIQSLNIKSLEDKSKYEKIILKISFSFFFILIVFYIYGFFFKYKMFFNLKDFLTINIIITKMKQYIIGASQFISSGCIKVDNLFQSNVNGITFPMETLKYLLGSYSDYLFAEYNLLLAFFGKHMTKTLVQEISDIVYEQHIFTYLNKDYSVFKEESDFNHELNYFHYLSGYINESETFLSCKIMDYYVLNKTLDTEANFHEQALFYIHNNVINTLLTLIENMLTKAAFFLDKEIESNTRDMTIYNIILLTLGIIGGFGLVIIIIINQKKIKLSLIMFLKIKSKDKLLENKLEKFKLLFFDLDNETSMEYEDSKYSILIPKRIRTRSSKKKNQKHFAHQNMNLKFDMVNSPNQKNRISQKNVYKSTHLCIINNKTEEGDNNINNSSIITTVPNDQRTISIKQSPRKKSQQNIQQDNDIPNTQNTLSVSFFSIPLIKSIIFYLSLCLFIHTVLILFNIYMDINNFKRILSSKRLSFYYLDRTPSYNQILLYYRSSILLNNSNTIINPRSTYKEMLTNFDTNSIDESLLINKQFDILDESHMAFLYYRFQLEAKSIKLNENKVKGNILANRNEYTKKINANSGSCHEIGKHYAYYNYTEFDSFNQDIIEQACLAFDGGVIDNGAGIIDNYFTYLIDDYIDFCSDTSGNKNILGYMLSDTYAGLFYKMVYVYNVSWETTSSIIQIDIDVIFRNVEGMEITLQVVEIISGFINVFIVLFFIVLSLENKSNTFKKVMNKLNFTENIVCKFK